MPINWSEGILICDLADEPDLSEELNAVLARLGGTKADAMPHLVINMSDVSYLNSSNIAQLLRVRKVLVEAQRKMILCSVPDPVWSLMLLTNLDKVFHFASDKPSAIASLQLESGGGAG
ncbi:MAG: STAS domain-containing protein [Phycisphaerales bacterium]